MNRVLIDCLKIRRQNTGLFEFCVQLGKALIRNSDPGRETLNFYVPKRQPNPFGSDQKYCLQHPFHKIWMPKANQFDLWHSTYQNSRYLPPPGTARMVLTIHDLNFLVEDKLAPKKINRYLGQIQSSIDRADHIVCISEFTRLTVSQHLRLGERPVEVIYNGCSVNEFPAFDQPRYRPRSPFIFTVGTVLPKKNFHVLPCLLKGNDYQLLIAGIVDSAYEKSILEAARLHQVGNRVRLLGPISEAEKSWYYRESLAFAFPSLAEGFGLPVVEAMHYGKPIFLSTHASLPEIAGAYAYYFENFDASYMQEVFRAGMLDYIARDRAQGIRRHALRYSWDAAAKSYLRLYRQYGPR